ncbi:hypothetical protein [Schinkia azotoformans]|uniref:hypothetical protein n=1 Tax=Schinkia azotoformans TaxID=1454 RepID=UPI002DBAF085|nr:hypothetical protein [Schinkia azotoformans]MEC1722530.1 hypothetical protein [Schinkia azotoformans]MED4415866.1 hypothetical protein [Schinkia azotoformans]
MGQKFGYLCTKKHSEAQLFKGVVKADKFYIDLATDRGWSSYEELNNLIEEVEENDQVIMSSMVMVCATLEEVYNLLYIFRYKGVKLNLLNPIRGEEIFLTEGGFKTLEAIFNLRRDLTKNSGVIEIKAENQIKHRENQEVFPAGFYQMFIDYKNNGLNAEVAAKKLKIDVHKFYRLVREFG